MAETPDNLAGALRILYSLREKAGMDPAGAPHLRYAARRIPRVKQEIGLRLKKEAKQLQSALHRKDALLAQAQRGAQNPEDVNRRAREVSASIESTRQSIATLNRAMKAERAADIGGFLDLPLEQYDRKLPAGFRGFWRRLWAEDGYNILVALVAALIGVLAVVYLYFGGQVSFDLVPLNPEAGQFQVRCVNHANREAEIFAPWTGEVRPYGNRERYGLKLEIRTESAQDFRPYVAPASVWRHEGKPTTQQEPLRVLPKLDISIELHLEPIQDQFNDLTGVRILAVSGAGQTVASFVLNLAG